MSNNTEDAKKILEYWRMLEMFNPYKTMKSNKCDNIVGKESTLQDFISKNKKNGKTNDEKSSDVRYIVQCGKFSAQEIESKIIAAFDENKFCEVDAKIEELACLCTFKVDAMGRYVQGSFNVPRYIWAAAKIINNASASVCSLEASEYESFQGDFINNCVEQNWLGSQKICIEITNSDNEAGSDEDVVSVNDKEQQEYDITDNVSVDYDEVIKIVSCLIENLGLDKAGLAGESIYIESDSADNEDGITMDFYTDELKGIQDSLSEGGITEKYIKALLNGGQEDKISIDNDNERLKEWLDIEKYPFGKWASEKSPNLMQQVAVNIAASEEEKIFSVNGAPGTGKTTLIKEIVASTVVKRAIKFAKLKSLDAVFEGVIKLTSVEKIEENGYQDVVYTLKEEYAHDGIIVASNNNTAVENISLDLPKKESVNFESFLGDADLSDIYFSQISDNFCKEKTTDDEEKETSDNVKVNTWGAISARMGRSKNIKIYRNSFFKPDSNTSVISSLQKELNIEKSKGSKRNRADVWKKAKDAFNTALAEVTDMQSKIKAIQGYVKEKEALIKSREQNAEKINQCKKVYCNYFGCDYNSTQESTEQRDRLQQQKASEIINRDTAEHVLKHTRYFIIKQLFKKKREAAEKVSKESATKIHEYQTQIDNISDIFINVSANEAIERKLRELCEYSKENHICDDEFWKLNSYDGEKRKAFQTACPWKNEDYDIARQKLFFYALRLMRAFVLCSDKFNNNLVKFNNFKKIKDSQEKKAVYSHLLNTVMLLVPVMSTTFASVKSFLKCAGEGSLGTLIIDEAGQAVPQAAVGAIWRSKRAIVVGDPLQIEPICNVPDLLINGLCKNGDSDNDIIQKYRSNTISVQNLADNAHKYKSQINDTTVGFPLLTHYRCEEPMFSISNEIAYGGKMNSVAKQKSGDFIFERSHWENICGEEIIKNNHYISAQGEYVAEIVKNAYTSKETMPDLFIISPFRTVVSGIKKALKEALPQRVNEVDDWIKSHCGTVHTFQGKEADEVILVLGCSEKSRGATAWVNAKPNLINVAVTRAKHRLVVVGDKEIWSKDETYTGVMYEKLKKYNEEMKDKSGQKE